MASSQRSLRPADLETIAAVFDGLLHQARSTAGLPAPLEPIILRCEKKPEARFGSALELQAAIADDATAPATHELSIAVVPFKNLSTDQDAEFFCDGLTEDVTLDLSKVGNLRVISRTSAKQLKDSEKDLRAQGRELGVQYVLEGSVRRAGATSASPPNSSMWKPTRTFGASGSRGRSKTSSRRRAGHQGRHPGGRSAIFGDLSGISRGR